jgi:hypothetical protein
MEFLEHYRRLKAASAFFVQRIGRHQATKLEKRLNDMGLTKATQYRRVA